MYLIGNDNLLAYTTILYSNTMAVHSCNTSQFHCDTVLNVCHMIIYNINIHHMYADLQLLLSLHALYTRVLYSHILPAYTSATD